MSLHVREGEDSSQWASISRKQALSLFSLDLIPFSVPFLIPKARPKSYQSSAASLTNGE